MDEFLFFLYALIIVYMFLKIKKIENIVSLLQTKSPPPTKMAKDDDSEIKEKATKKTSLQSSPWDAIETSSKSLENNQPIKKEKTNIPSVEKTKKTLIDKLIENWMLVLGGISLFLASAFMIRYSISYGFFSPKARCVIGFSFGLLLVYVAQKLFYREHKKTVVPSILSGAGISFMFSASLASFMIYDLLSVQSGFVLLFLISAFAVVLSLKQGSIVALLGLVGSYLTPALANSQSQNAVLLFSYLLVVFISTIYIFHKMGWFKLFYSSYFLSFAWAFIWIFEILKNNHSDQIVISLFLATVCLVSFGLYIIKTQKKISNKNKVSLTKATIASFTISTLLMLFVCLETNFSQYSTTAFILFSIVFLCCIRYKQELASTSIPIGIISTLLLVAWSPLSSGGAWRYPLKTTGYRILGPYLPPEYHDFSLVACALFLVFLVCGSYFIKNSKKGLLWSVNACLFPFLIFMTSYFVIKNDDTKLFWSFLSVLVAFIYLYQTVIYQKKSKEILGLFCLTTFSYITLAFSLSLEKSWLTVSLSAIVLAMSYINYKLDVKYMRKAGLVLSFAVFIRLLLNPNLYTYDSFNYLSWIIYGYGIPAICFYFASKFYEKNKKDFLSDILLLFCTIFVFVGVLLQIHGLFNNNNPFANNQFEFLESGIYSCLLLLVSFFIYKKRDKLPNKYIFYFGVACNMLAFVNILISIFSKNPYFKIIDVSSFYIIDSLFINYLAPSIIYLLFAKEFKKQRLKDLSLCFFVGFIILSLVYFSLEIRHFFHGNFIYKSKNVSYIENVTYSILLLVYSVSLIVFGSFKKYISLRKAGNCILLIAIFKIFIFDLDNLDGLYRALSFALLGLSLIGVGYMNQKLKEKDYITK